LRRWTVLSILLFVCLTFPFTITNVVVKGLETVPLTSVLERIDYSGDLTEKDVEEIARTIFDMGYFASVKPELIPGKEGYTLLITVKENPKVKDWKITIDGEGLLDVKDLEKLVTIEKGKALNVKRVQESLENIKKAYEEAGYIFIEVTGNMRKDTFEIIVEEYALWDVFINGETAGIDISQIVKEANLNLLKDFYSASPLVRFFTMNKKKFYPRVSDINRFIQTLRLNAFFSEETTVNFKKVTMDNVEEKTIVLIVNVVQRKIIDKKRSFSCIEVTGNKLLSRDEILRAAKIKPGDVLENHEILAAMNRIMGEYKRRGYPFVWVDASVEKDKLMFKVYEKYISKIEVEGLKTTKPYIVRNLLRVYEGNPLKSEDVAETFSYLNNTRYFSSVDIKPLFTQNATDVKLIVDLKESDKHYFIVGGVAWAPPDGEWWEGLAGNVDLSAVNVWGYGQRFSFKLDLGIKKKTVSFDYKIPSPFALPFDFGFNVSCEKLNATDTSVATNTLTVGVDFTTLPIKGNTFRFGVSFDDVLNLENGKTLTVLGGYAYDKRDSKYVPKNGFNFGVNVWKAGILQFNAKDYVKVEGYAGFYTQILDSLTLNMKIFGGKVFLNRGKESVELWGPESLRGYDYLEGESAFLVSNNLNWFVKEDPVIVVLGLFLDHGDVSNDEGIFSNMKTSFGPKILMSLPILGNVEFGYAYKLMEREWAPYFVLGQEF